MNLTVFTVLLLPGAFLMSLRPLFILLLASLALSLACGPRSDETSPDMAQRLLKLRGYHFTQQGLFKAIRLGDGRAVKAFLQGGMDPNIQNAEGQTALTFALEVTDASMVGPLLDKADLGLRDSAGNTPIFVALKNDHGAIFEMLLEKTGDVNSAGRNRNVNNQTLLLLAVQKRNSSLVNRLLEKGADANRADDNGLSPLLASVTGEPIDMDILRSLLDKGAAVDHQSAVRGATALNYAISNFATESEIRMEAVRLLIERGADVNLQEPANGYTALMYAFLDGRSQPAFRISMLKYLLENGADKTLKTVEGESVIDWTKNYPEPDIDILFK